MHKKIYALEEKLIAAAVIEKEEAKHRLDADKLRKEVDSLKRDLKSKETEILRLKRDSSDHHVKEIKDKDAQILTLNKEVQRLFNELERTLLVLEAPAAPPKDYEPMKKEVRSNMVHEHDGRLTPCFRSQSSRPRSARCSAS